MSFQELISERVCSKAGMVDSGFFRSDELPAGTALGYLEGFAQRTNVLHLPVGGSGDGGMYTTVADMGRFWSALLAGHVISLPLLAEALRSPSEQPAPVSGYGLGFWLGPQGGIQLEGCDAGVSFRSVHTPNVAFTVASNTSSGAWPVCRVIEEELGLRPIA